MGRRDEVLDEFRAAERRRIADWREWTGTGRVVAREARSIAGIESGVTATLHAPFEVDLAVTPAWHVDGAVVVADDLEVYVRVTAVEDGDVTEVEVHPVGPCLRCGRSAPLGPVTRREDFPAALFAGVPASGHACSR
jgi:hypothetical protein